MRFADEVRPTSPIPTGGKKPTKRQVDNAVAVISELSTEWDPTSYTDCYRERLRKVIESKRKRRKIEVPETEIDSITYEVVRHGLWNANAEHVREIENLAVSQITVEIRDF